MKPVKLGSFVLECKDLGFRDYGLGLLDSFFYSIASSPGVCVCVCVCVCADSHSLDELLAGVYLNCRSGSLKCSSNSHRC